MTSRLPKLIVCLMLLVGITGCGYSQSGQGGYQWQSLWREDVKTVAVPIFANRAYTRSVEFSLTKAIISQLEAHSPYKVVAREKADTILEGEIMSVRQNTVSKDSNTAIPQEQLYIVSVDFTWKDLRTGQILVARRNFEQTTTYYPTLGEGQFVGQQQSVERLAQGIVQELQADW